MQKLTACVVGRAPGQARALFDREIGSTQQAEAIGALFADSGDCLDGTGSLKLQTSKFMALGSIAENLIEADAVVLVAPVSDSIPAGGGTYEWTVLRLTHAYEWKLVPVARCLLIMHPSWVRELLSIQSVTNDERKLFERSVATLRDCVPAGEHMILNPIYLRAALAIATYSAERARQS